MRRQLRSKSIKKTKTKLSGRVTIHFQKKKPAYAKCGNCGKKLNRARLRAAELKKLSRMQRRPERPAPHLCVKCMREQLKLKIRG